MDSDSSQELSDDWTLAKRLKYDDPVQFHTLVRMHLSFVLDLNTDDCDSQPEKSKLRSLKWSFVPFTKKIKTTGKSQEGMQLTKDGMSQVYQLIEYLSQDENVVQEGIFRRTGKLTRQQELKSLLNSGALVDFGESLYSVHDCASVLKTILAELQEPLLTETYFPAYCQIADLCTQKPNDDRLLQALQLLFLLLPSENWKVLRDIMELLHLVASHENENKMSADNLATLFTPHLLCPRKLQPEAFHATSQMLSKVVAFMISAGPELFNIPSSLATDIKMYWERRKRSPENFLNESSAATTVFSFVDRERTAQENTTNPTEAALAQLYAHIQSLPESSKKRRLVKQFNRENGNGTPNNNRARSIGDSIKKHIFNKTVKPARGFCELGQLKKRSCSEEILNSPESKTPKCFQRLKSGKSCDNIEAEQSSSPLNERIVEDIDVSKPKVELEDKPDVSILNSPVPIPEKENSPFFTPCNPSLMKHRKLSVSKAPLTPPMTNRYSALLTSTPACNNCLLSPSPNDMSPITLSTQRMSKAMQETMMTPRSRKPVVAVSASNICHLANLTWGLKDDPSWDQDDSDTGESLAGAFKEYLSSRSVLTASPVDLSFSSRTGDYDPSSEGRLEDLSHDEIPHSPLSESLLYVLDGNLPNESSDSSGYIDGRHRKRGAEVSGFIPNKRFGPEMSGESSGLGTENSKETPHETSL
ncbi:rho GTPase-activating protein 19-like isoform X1 [Macrosteles quadrilineatus]|uniref:rho GTPase-activating protein 19-like isoform X1 n=1 Tax=Macrosteles quadrilineatus TaxID=74068 RepID=UPI0023E16241|nr:rho GTPase-activating protein 19-like isoform X1 [Macrosteles quadrilineatus]